MLQITSIESITQGFKRLVIKNKRQSYADKFTLAKKNYQYYVGEEQKAQWAERHDRVASFE